MLEWRDYVDRFRWCCLIAGDSFNQGFDNSTTLSGRVQIILYIELYVSIQLLIAFFWAFSFAVPHSLFSKHHSTVSLSKNVVSRMFVFFGIGLHWIG